MNIDMVLGGSSYTPENTVGLAPIESAFIAYLYEAVYDKPFGDTGRTFVSAAERETALGHVEAKLPSVSVSIGTSPTGRTVLPKLRARVGAVASGVTRNAITAKAVLDAPLAVELRSREAQEARETALQVLAKTYGLADSFLTAASSADPKVLSGAESNVKDGLGTLFKVLKTVDPEEYRKSIDEAREYCAEHGVALGVTKGIQVVAEITDLTAGTTVAVGSTLSKFAMAALGGGASLEALKALEESGELIRSTQKAALTFGKMAEFLESFEKVLSVVAIAGGFAKLITADTNFEKVDAGVDITVGTVSLVGKVTGEAAFGTAASAVMLPWMGVKYVKFLGELGGGAIEGTFYAGLREELGEIEARGDAVVRDLYVLSSILDERERRAADPAFAGKHRAGADEAVEDAAYRLQKSLAAASQRWQVSRIDALARAYPSAVREDAAWAGQRDYPPELVASAAGDFMGSLTDAYRTSADIVIEMGVDAGFYDEEAAVGKRKKMHDAAAKAAKAKSGAGE